MRSPSPYRVLFIFLPLVLLALAAAAPPAEATHFRYGQLNWRARPDLGPRTIEFTLNVALRRNGYVGSHPDGDPDIGDDVRETIGNTRLFFGDGSNTPILDTRVTTISPRQNFIYGPLHVPGSPTVTIRHTYPSNGDFVASIDTCCRISGCVPSGGIGGLGNRHINNPNGRYRLETIVNVGSGNTPPTSTLFPIIACRRNEVCSFRIPREDADGDVVRFRLSTSQEAAGGVFRQPGDPGSGAPNPVTLTSFGILSWDTTGAQISGDQTCPRTLYSTQVMMEDLDENGDVKSKTPLDFFLLLGGSGTPPQFEPPTPCGEVQFGTPQNLISFTVTCSDPDPDDEVTLNVVGLPNGARMDPPLPLTGAPGQPVSSTFTFTPINAQVGRGVISFSATDRTNQEICQIPIDVSSCNDDDLGDPEIVTFDVDTMEMDIPPGTDISGDFLQDLGIRMTGVSGINGNPGVYTNHQGPPGSDTDDIIPQSGLNFITTLADPLDLQGSDYGEIIIDFVDPLTHLRRHVELAELFFLDVEDSIATLTAYDEPGATGNVLDFRTTRAVGVANQFRLNVGARVSEFRIASIRAQFGSPDDSAALDSLCSINASNPLQITDDLGENEVIGVRPGGDVSFTITMENQEDDTFLGTFAVYFVFFPDDPSRRRAEMITSRDFRLAGHRTASKEMSYRIPYKFGERNVGRTFQLAHYVCDREMIVQSKTLETFQIVNFEETP